MRARKPFFARPGLKLTNEQWADFGNDKDLILSASEALEGAIVQGIAEFNPPAGTVLFPI